MMTRHLESSLAARPGTIADPIAPDDDFQAMLASNPHKTVLDVALEVGFNSKSTFNTAFRTHTGMTPTGYRRSQQRKESSALAEGEL